MRYWDASALVSLVVQQPQSAVVRAMLRQDTTIVTWWGTPVEIFSGLCRLQREKRFAATEIDTLRERFTRLASSLDTVIPSLPIRERALRLLRIHAIRAADALQLAAALQWCQELPALHAFICLDDKLSTAARNEGFQVFPA